MYVHIWICLLRSILQAANEPGECVMESFDIRNEHGTDTSMGIEEARTLPSLTGE